MAIDAKGVEDRLDVAREIEDIGHAGHGLEAAGGRRAARGVGAADALLAARVRGSWQPRQR